MEYKKTFLLGVIDKQIITCDIEKRWSLNKRNELAISFNIGELVNISSIMNTDYIEEYFNNIYESADDYTKLYYYLKDGLINKDSWLTTQVNNIIVNKDYQNIIDCSCTDYEFTKNKNIYNFETAGCGQYDVRENDKFADFIYTNKEAFDIIMSLWDNYHIKNLTEKENDEINKELEKVDTLLQNYDCDEFTENDCLQFVFENMEV